MVCRPQDNTWRRTRVVMFLLVYIRLYLKKINKKILWSLLLKTVSIKWGIRLSVRTIDFQSIKTSSILVCPTNYLGVRKWLIYSFWKRETVGSNPTVQTNKNLPHIHKNSQCRVVIICITTRDYLLRYCRLYIVISCFIRQFLVAVLNNIQFKWSVTKTSCLTFYPDFLPCFRFFQEEKKVKQMSLAFICLAVNCSRRQKIKLNIYNLKKDTNSNPHSLDF